MAPTAGLSISQRLAHALLSYLHYLQALIVPRRMAVFYPYGMSPPIAEVVFASIVLALVTTLVLRSPQRYLPMGWFWFLGMLVPVIGLVQVGDQAWADRYTYLPSIGLFILLAWGAGAAVNRWRLPKVVWGIAAAAVLLSCAARTRDQLATWRNSLALFHHAIAVIPNNWLAWFNLGVAMERQGQPDEALVAYRKTLDLHPNHMDTLINIGAIFTDRKQFAEAVLYFERAVSARPGSVICHDNLAHSLMELGKFEAALPHLRLVVQQQPKNLVALDALSQTLARTGQFDEAVVTMQKARDLAQAAGQTKLAEKAQQLIELYRSHRSN
jgi:Flp pilus assembly protein TadD